MNQHLGYVDVRGLEKFRHDTAPVSLFFLNPPRWNSTVSADYGTCFQDCDFKVTGRLITMRPLPFFGPGNS